MRLPVCQRQLSYLYAAAGDNENDDDDDDDEDVMCRSLCFNSIYADDGICTGSVCDSGAQCSEALNQVNCRCPSGTGGSRCSDSTYQPICRMHHTLLVYIL